MRGTTDAPLRILHLGKFLPPHPGGIERFLADLLPAQRRLGLRPAVLAHADPGNPSTHCRRALGAAAVQARVLARLAYAPVSPGWPCLLDRLIRRWRPQLLHLHLPNPSAFWALALPSARRLPWLIHWHADVPHDALSLRLRLLYPGYRRLETALLRRARRVVATSAAYAASSRPLAPWQDKVRVLPLGLADGRAAAATMEAWPAGTGLRVLFVGRFSYYKGIDHLLEAVAATPGVQLLLIGDGDLARPVRERAARPDLAGRVALPGSLDDAALATALAAADVLCLPSIERSEAFGMVLLEAMRAGVPCLATRVPGSGMTEVLAADGPEPAGLVVPPADPRALAEALGRLRDDPLLRARLGQAGARRFQRCYRIDAVAQALQAVYRECLADGAAA
ncbi:MAG: glycosyltransferase [Xanthomonadales bacterium]|nr:glycosyltransferase [Xanthomonadales bacterium]